MELYDKCLKYLIYLLNYFCAILLGTMAIVVFANVLARYVFSSSMPWAEEIARFLLVWTVFIGAAVAFYYDEHLGLDLLTSRLKGRIKNIVSFISYIAIGFTLMIVIIYGYNFAVMSIDWPGPASKIPYGIVYMIAPVTSGIMFITLIDKFLKLFIQGGR